MMKYVMVVGDGMADFPIEALSGRTPLAFLSPDSFARIGGGEMGRLRSCPEGLPPGSDVAFLTLFGNDAKACYRGRSPLEAAGLKIPMAEGEVAFRLNMAAITDEGYPGGKMLSHNGGGIDGEDAETLIHDLMADEVFASMCGALGMYIAPTDTFRHVAIMPGAMEKYESLTPPHDIVGQRLADHLPASPEILALMERSFAVLKDHPINKKRRAEGKLAANSAWLWGAGSAYILDDFATKYNKTGTVISAVPLVKGIARLNGLFAPEVVGATGLLDTNYQGKLDAALSALAAGDDFALVHLEAPDEMSHDGSLEHKLEAIRRLSERIVEPLMAQLPALGDFRLMLLPDHYTLLSTRTHDATPVPFAIYDSRRPGAPRPFTEAEAGKEPILESGDALLRRFFEIE